MQVKTAFEYTFTFTEREFSLIIRGLGMMAGVKVSSKPADRDLARELNEQLLTAQRGLLKSRLEITDGKLQKFHETLQSEGQAEFNPDSQEDR